MKEKLYGATNENKLTASQSFVQKNEFVELFDHHTKYRPVHGVKDPINLHVIELPQTYPKKKSGEKRKQTQAKNNSKKSKLDDKNKPTNTKNKDNEDESTTKQIKPNNPMRNVMKKPLGKKKKKENQGKQTKINFQPLKK